MKCGVMLILIYAVNLPWAVRNYHVWKKPIYFSATGYYDYAIFNPFARGNISRLPRKGEPYYSEEFQNTRDEGELHQIGMAQAKKWIHEHPLDSLNLAVQKGLWLMSPDDFEWALSLAVEGNHGVAPDRPSFKVQKILTRLEQWIYVLLLYSFGMLLFLSLILGGPRGIWNLASATILFTVLAVLGGYSVIYGFAKYRFTVEPLMFMLTLYFLYHLAGIFSASSKASGKGRKFPHALTANK